MEFCKCGSLVKDGNCTNKKCKLHALTFNDDITYNQMQYIESLRSELHYTSEIDFKTITKRQAMKMIDDLIKRKDGI